MKSGEPIPITVLEMTRFLFTLDDATTTVLEALHHSEGGETFLPRIRSFRIQDIMQVLAEYYNVELKIENVGKRPGEKVHEDLMSPLELENTFVIGDLLVILPEVTRRRYSYRQKYEGARMNSEWHVDKDPQRILDLLKRGMNL